MFTFYRCNVDNVSPILMSSGMNGSDFRVHLEETVEYDPYISERYIRLCNREYYLGQISRIDMHFDQLHHHKSKLMRRVNIALRLLQFNWCIFMLVLYLIMTRPRSKGFSSFVLDNGCGPLDRTHLGNILTTAMDQQILQVSEVSLC